MSNLRLTEFEALSFDCYGTLIDWEAGIGAVLSPWAREQGLEITTEQLLLAYADHEAAVERDTPSAPYPEVLAESFRRTGATLGSPVSEAWAQQLGDSVPDWPAFPDSAEALARLATHYRLIIVSNVHRDGFAGSNRHLRGEFAAVITAEDVGAYKPAENHFRALDSALDGLGVERSGLLHVAQSLFHDHVPARREGLPSVWINRRHDRPGWGATPEPSQQWSYDLEFRSMGEFADAVELAFAAVALPPAVATTDYHTGGEPFRIVAEPPVAIPGTTVAERRARAIEDPQLQSLRAVLCSEPRGHADMYGGFVVPPDDDGAELGVLFWHKDGFSTACGHGTIALGVWAVESGRVSAPDTGSVDVVIDVPSGRVTARVHCEAGRVVAVDFVNVPSWVIARDVPVTTTRGEVPVTVAYGGAIYATLPAAELQLSVTPEDLGDLITLGREIKWALDDSAYAVHPTDDRLNGIYGTILFDELDAAPGTVHQRNVTIFADGEVDRSPCGSGTCARLAVLSADGRLPAGAVLQHDSIVGTTFVGTVLSTEEVDGRATVVPQVTGMAYRTGEHIFRIDPRDPLLPGFVLR